MASRLYSLPKTASYFVSASPPPCHLSLNLSCSAWNPCQFLCILLQDCLPETSCRLTTERHICCGLCFYLELRIEKGVLAHVDKHLYTHLCGFVVVNTHVHAYVLAKPVLLYAYICMCAYDLLNDCLCMKMSLCLNVHAHVLTSIYACGGVYLCLWCSSIHSCSSRVVPKCICMCFVH